MALWEASNSAQQEGTSIYSIVDINEYTQVLAVIRSTDIRFVTEDAVAGAHMLFMSGSRLEQMLLEYGLLTKIRGPDDAERVCTVTQRVRQIFTNLCYVIISRSVDYYPNCR